MSTAPALRHIVFVDDDPDVLKGLAVSLRRVRRTWRTSFCSSGQQALDLMEQKRCDVIVSDMRMPGMDGATLLGHVRKKHPSVIRFVLSGHADQYSSLGAVSCAHQWMAKPCSREELLRAIERACSIRDLHENPALERAVGSIGALPVLPEPYRSILERISDPGSSVSEIADLVVEDPALCARFLQIVNSAFYGLPTTVVDVGNAISLLGLKAVSQILLSSGSFTVLGPDAERAGFSFAELQRDSVIVSRLASSLVADATDAAAATTAGMLHDLGSLLFVRSRGREFVQLVGEASRKGIPQWQLEEKNFGMTHAEVGGVLLGIWGLPLDVVEAVAFHHSPQSLQADTINAAVAVHLARTLLDDSRSSRDARAGGHSIDRDLLLRLGLDRVPDEWWERTSVLDETQDESRDEAERAAGGTEG